MEELTKRSKQQTKTIILGRNRMLTCGRNFKATMSEICKECNEIDDEDHRLNECLLWSDTNFRENAIKPKFNEIFSENDATLSEII